jgi:hypothetical protein
MHLVAAALAISGFVCALTMRAAEPLCEQAGLGKL